MNYPKLVLSTNSIATITLESGGTNEYGEPIAITLNNVECNYQAKSYDKYSKNGKAVLIKGKAYIDGDITNGVIYTDGTMTVYNNKHDIESVTVARNLDGTVNYTLIELL